MLFWILLVIAFIYLDQLTKYLAVICLRGEPSFPIIKDVIHFTYVENRGAAFGMLKDHRWIFMIVSTVAIICIAIYFVRHYKDSKMQSLALSMLIAGGIGNMIDRTALGYVIDFIDFTLIDFAVFNVADSFVCVGVGILVLYLILEIVKESKEAAKTVNAEQTAPEETEASENKDGE